MVRSYRRSCHASTCPAHTSSLVFLMLPCTDLHKNKVKFNNRFVVAGAQQLDSTRKALKKWKPIAFAQKDKSHGGTNESRWKLEVGASFQWRHNASISSSIFEELPKCFWQVWKKLLTRVSFRHGYSYIKREFPNVFSNVMQKWPFCLNETIFSKFELAHAVKTDALQVPPKDEKCKKHRVFSISCSTWSKKSWRQLQGGESADSLVFPSKNDPW